MILGFYIISYHLENFDKVSQFSITGGTTYSTAGVLVDVT